MLTFQRISVKIFIFSATHFDFIPFLNVKFACKADEMFDMLVALAKLRILSWRVKLGMEKIVAPVKVANDPNKTEGFNWQINW